MNDITTIFIGGIFMFVPIIVTLGKFFWDEERVKKFFVKLGIVPQYTEVSLFLMSFTLVMAFALAPEIRDIAWRLAWKLSERIINVESTIAGLFILAMIFLLFLYPIAISIYHVFSLKGKTEFQKSRLLTFAITMDFFVGLAGSTLVLMEQRGYLIFFPLVNITHGFLLAYLHYEHGFFDNSSISGRNAKISEVIIGAFVIAGIFYTSHHIFKNHLFLTISICFGYISILSELMTRLFSRKLSGS